MTPQQLIDLRGAGEAKKRVKAMGMWRETITDSERIEWLEENDATVRWTGFDDVWDIHETSHLSPVGSLRSAIDEAAIKQTAKYCSGYLED